MLQLLKAIFLLPLRLLINTTIGLLAATILFPVALVLGEIFIIDLLHLRLFLLLPLSWASQFFMFVLRRNDSVRSVLGIILYCSLVGIFSPLMALIGFSLGVLFQVAFLVIPPLIFGVVVAIGGFILGVAYGTDLLLHPKQTYHKLQNWLNSLLYVQRSTMDNFVPSPHDQDVNEVEINADAYLTKITKKIDLDSPVLYGVELEVKTALIKWFQNAIDNNAPPLFDFILYDTVDKDPVFLIKFYFDKSNEMHTVPKYSIILTSRTNLVDAINKTLKHPVTRDDLANPTDYTEHYTEQGTRTTVAHKTTYLCYSFDTVEELSSFIDRTCTRKQVAVPPSSVSTHISSSQVVTYSIFPQNHPSETDQVDISKKLGP